MGQKGSKFERDICKELSLWWSNGLRDDIFWRTAGSGARAKVRGRKNKQTSGQHGDIGATDPIGAPLIDLITIELKRGYSKHTIADLLDKPKNGGKQVYEEWIEQAVESHQHAKSMTWMIIVKRDRREALVIMPTSLAVSLHVNSMITPMFSCKVTITGLILQITSITLQEFLDSVPTNKVKDLIRKYRKANAGMAAS
jgi:hypothetical protein